MAARPLADARLSELNDVVQSTGRHWGPRLVNGLLMILIGMVLLAWPRPSLAVIGVLFAITLLANGIAQILRSIANTDAAGGRRVLYGLVGALSLLVGVLCLRAPLQTIAAIALLIGSWWVVSGVLTLIAAASGATEGRRGWAFLFGVLSVVGGFVVLLQPALTLTAITITLGVSLIVLGIVAMVDAIAQRALG